MFNTLKVLFLFLVPSLFAFSMCHWADIPEGNYQEILFSDSPNCLQLNRLIESYHREPKDCPIAAGIRIAKLMDIRDFLKKWLNEDPSHPGLKALLKNVENKYTYLKAIMRLYIRGKTKLEHLEEYHLALSDNQAFTPLCLSNEIIYSFPQGQYCGAYWIESIDPCHRVLGDYYKKWLLLKENKKACPWFFLWLETQNVPLNIPVVKYLHSWEITDSQLYIKDGQMCDYVTGEPLDGTFLCVVNSKDQVYVHAQEEGVYASSFSRGKPVKAAGYIECKAGMITELTFDSDRYVPTVSDHFFQLTQALVKNSISMAPSVIIHFPLNHMNYEIAIQSAIMDDKDTFVNELYDENNRLLIVP